MAQASYSTEIGTGLFVLLGFAALAFLTTQLPGSGLQLSRPAETYSVIAKFDNIGGLKVGAPVTMAGVRVGRVAAINLDSSDYRAAVSLSIDRGFAKIPDDSDAGIQTAGLLGANYIGITAGGSDKFLQAGSQIQFTQSALVLETLINKFFANTADSKSAGSNATGSNSKAK
jgi:phospholipid/cholesterol/gamma-HCH transport system substrate-binding protein